MFACLVTALLVIISAPQAASADAMNVDAVNAVRGAPSGTKRYSPLSSWLFTLNPDDAGSWRPVSIPHTWSSQKDIRTRGCYRTLLPTAGTSSGPTFVNQEDGSYRTSDGDGDSPSAAIVLDVGAANSRASVFANTVLFGTHDGGFSRFRFELPQMLITSPATMLELCVDNSANLTSVLPLAGDFTFFGGVFRDIGFWVVKMGVAVLDMFDLGSSGVKFVQTNALSRGKLRRGTFDARVRVSCFGNLTSTSVTVAVRVENPKTGEIVADASKTISILPTCLIATQVSVPFAIESPILWDGRIDPFLYRAKVELIQDNGITDSYATFIGVRSYYVDPQRGFLLNGRAYQLYGVNLHQDWAGLGWAIHKSHTQQNFKLMDELNITALRCAHYQHSEDTYTLADQYGFVVWAEIPNIGFAPASPALYFNAASQLRELIKQAYNHPSILFWSMANELLEFAGNYPFPLVSMLHNIAKSEDPYRMTTMAINTDPTHAANRVTDSVSINTYHGWYESTADKLGASLDAYHSSTLKAFGISEYGAGASIYIHSEHPAAGDHSEEYQAQLHAESWPQLAARRYLWWRTVWNFADFASAQRNEGDSRGMNDKGLVTYDRAVRKDAFFYYRCMWRRRDPIVWITARRMTFRDAVVNITIYAGGQGAEELRVILNGNELDTQLVKESCVHKFINVELANGKNEIRAVVGSGGKEFLSDVVSWYNVD
ncbi:hypothetical protein HDU84_003950 [Entophlyctis sp. JEL0112]|nr:hypothetical protein HDU84_003950 [Entophlyctis sp. JEL0112]